MIAKKHLSIIAFLFFITLIVFQLFIPLFSNAAEDENEASYTLVWADEFNMDGRPNPNNWVFETGFVRNLEEQWYQPENAWCENGMLMIESRRERVPNPNYDPDSSRCGTLPKNLFQSSVMPNGHLSFMFGVWIGIKNVSNYTLTVCL